MTRAEIHDFIDREFDPLDHVPHRKGVYRNMATDPKKSEGARYERKAMRAYLTRRIAKLVGNGAIIEAQRHLEWVRSRQARYDQKPGGL